MKIGLNATCFNERPSGAKQRFIGIYSRVFEKLKNVRFIIFEPNDFSFRDIFPNFQNVDFIKTDIPSTGRLIKFLKSVRYFNTLNTGNIKIFEGYHLPFIGISNSINILTIHDIRGISDHESNIFKRIIFKLALNFSIKNSDEVITVSKTMKDEIFKASGVNNIKVIYNGIEKDFNKFNVESLPRQSNLIGIKDYFLTVGHFEQRKNFSRLIQAYAVAKQDKNIPKLIIIGNDNGSLNECKALIAKLKLENDILIFHGINDQELKLVYENASFFLFPSLYEGFGIPIIEAMSFNKRIAASDIDIFREIAGSQIQYFNPYSITAISNIIKIMSSNPISKIHYGYNALEKFEFENTAQKYINFYNELLKKR